MTPFFDGMEGDPARTEAACPGCGAPIPLDAWNFRGRSGDDITDEEVEAFGLFRGWFGWIRVTCVAKDDVAAYIGAVTCPGCGRTVQIALGLGEVQPARWQAVLVGAR